MGTSKWVWAVVLIAVVSAKNPCNSLRDAAVSLRNISSSSNVIGATETITFSGGDIITGDLFVMEDAKVTFVPGISPLEPIIVQGNIFLFDRAALVVEDATQVTISQTAPSQYNIYAFDSSEVEFQGGVIDHGSSRDLQQTWHLCHSSKASTTQAKYDQRNKGSVAAFLWDTASLTVDKFTGSFLDVTLANSTTFTATANPELARAHTNFVVDETIADPLSGWSFESFTASKQVISASGHLNATVAISGTRTTFGLVLHSGSDVVLNQSEFLLIPTWGSYSTFNTPATDLQPCSRYESSKGNICLRYEDRRASLGAGPARAGVRFLNSQVELWKANFDGSGVPTTHRLTASILAETNCRSQAVCTYEGVTINGDQWGLCTVDDAEATHVNGAIVTFTYVRNHARAVFDKTSFTYNTRKPGICLQVDNNSVVKLINTRLPTMESIHNSTQETYRVSVDSSSLFLRAAIAPLPTQTIVDDDECGAIMAPMVEMEVLPLSAPRSFTLEVLDDIQSPVALRSITNSPPAFMYGGAEWGGNASLFTPIYSGVYVLQITTTSGNESAVARQLVNVTGCKAVGCPYPKITTLFDVCDPALFTGVVGTCVSDECRAAASDLTQSWRSFTTARKLTCVTNYPRTVGSRVPYELNITEAAIRLSQRDLCGPLVSNAPVSSPIFALVLLSVMLLL